MEIKLETEYITLGQFLKITNYVSSGGEAKLLVKQLLILVNGKAENRRGRKLYHNDKIVIKDKEFVIV